MEAFFREVMDESRRLGLAWWERLALIIATALLVVASRRIGAAAWDALRSIEWKVEPAPAPVSDGGTAADRDLPAATTDPTVSGRLPEDDHGG
jgi:hypothetical protein